MTTVAAYPHPQKKEAKGEVLLVSVNEHLQNQGKDTCCLSHDFSLSFLRL